MSPFYFSFVMFVEQGTRSSKPATHLTKLVAIVLTSCSCKYFQDIYHSQRTAQIRTNTPDKSCVKPVAPKLKITTSQFEKIYANHFEFHTLCSYAIPFPMTENKFFSSMEYLTNKIHDAVNEKKNSRLMK